MCSVAALGDLWNSEKFLIKEPLQISHGTAVD